MKFANKLFFMTTTVLTVIFAVFGIWMLSSYFNEAVDREMEQAGTESQMFQILFEMSYQSIAEYGEEYAIKNVTESVVPGIEQRGNICFVWSEQKDYYGAAGNAQTQLEGLKSMAEQLKNTQNYACGIRQYEEEYYLLTVCKASCTQQNVYLGLSKDITSLYEDRANLLNQYRLALGLLLLVGGVCIFVLSQYITWPIRRLNAVVEKIADGRYEVRSKYSNGDEIGKLSENFNHMADRLMQQMHEKEEEARQKEQFTAAFAHELKTPLTSIIGYADMLNSVDMTEAERREAYYYIYTQGKRLESLSHKLLELVSMEKGSFRMLPIQTKELEAILREAVRPIFATKKRQWKITLEKGVIHGDKDLLLSVFYNLLDNAVKATDEDGYILLKGHCIEEGYEIKVVDNGRGIPRQEISRITEAFYMVDKSRSRKEGGAGIGMTLCQRIMELHDGKMRIRSKLGEGTVILLHLPKRETEEQI